MILDNLKNIGLSEEEVRIYDSLLNNGGQTAGQIISATKLKRGDCYNKIYDLKEKGLLIESEKNKKKFFELESPEKIESYIQNRIEVLEQTDSEIKSIMPNIISSYNLAYHKPGVKFFEGEEGMKKIMADSLTAKSTIFSYVDVAAVEKYISKINKSYAKKRQKLNIKKKLIVSDTNFNKKFFSKLGDKATEVKYIDAKIDSSNTAMQIYDNKISYLTLKPESMMGVIIEDPLITKMHRTLFESNWKSAKGL